MGAGGNEIDCLEPLSSKSTVFTRRKVLSSALMLSRCNPVGGVVVVLFAFFFIHGFSFVFPWRVFGFANALAGSGSDFERTAVDLMGLGLAPFLIWFLFGSGVRDRLVMGFVCSTSCFWRLADEIFGSWY